MSKKDLKINIKYLCDTDEKRKKGLMNRQISNNQCAFFIFPSAGCHGFWNKNVGFDLSLIFLNDHFKVVDFGEMEANSENPIYPKSREIKYVIEIKKEAGIIENNFVDIDDYIDFDPESDSLVVKHHLGGKSNDK